MKNIFYVLIALIMLTTYSSILQAESVHNNNSVFVELYFDEAIVKAKKDKKLLMLFIHQEGGPLCEKMFEGTFRDKAVIRLLDKHYLSVAFDKYQDIFPDKYSTPFIPMIYLIDPSNEKTLRVSKGYTGAVSLADKLEEVAEFYDE